MMMMPTVSDVVMSLVTNTGDKRSDGELVQIQRVMITY